MRIPHYKALNLIKANKYHCFVIYGDNYGKISSLIKEIILYFSQKELVDTIAFDFKDKDKEVIGNIDYELNSASFFAQKKIIIINYYIDDNKIQNIVNLYSGNNILILVNHLFSKIKATLGMQNEQVLAISCYKNNEIQISLKLKALLFQYKLVPADNLTLNYMTSILSGDDLSIESEIEKLSIYKGNNRTLTMDDIRNVISDDESMVSYQVINDLIKINFKSLFDIKSSENNMLVIRMIYNYFFNLLNDDREEVTIFKKKIPFQYHENWDMHKKILNNNLNIIKILKILSISEQKYKIHQKINYYFTNIAINMLFNL
ncbi:MAG: hypothetical protein OEY79_03030 [Anaplasmataceae bacterium]|nr:hypothetical protein [Anaplasmataceae bacterium]